MGFAEGVLPDAFSLSSVALILGFFAVVVILNAIWSLVYNLYFHPLSHIPGPVSSRASTIPISLRCMTGDVAGWLQAVHDKYGDVVRVGPNEVSLISGESAWQDIYGFRTGKNKTPPYLKDTRSFSRPPNGVDSIILADEATHSRMRRNVSHAFSDKALREQEPLVQGLVDVLVNRLHEQVQENQPIVDIMRWYNFLTFDVITDLTFGEPLYCLRDKDYHPWITMVFAAVKIGGVMARAKQLPGYAYMEKLIGMFMDKDLQQKRLKFWKLVSAKVAHRLDQGTQRPDFMSHIVKNQDKGALALTQDEIVSNSVIFMLAGSETTATLLSGFTYLLLRNPDIYKKLVDEIRGKFMSMADITIDEVNKMEYLIATLQEALRYYPPVPTGFPRIVPEGGDTISGTYVAGGTSVYMSQHAANHSKRNWTDPDEFVPERWLGDAKYKDDNRAVYNPFSFGPRNCLGKNLAYAEMRLAVAKLLFNFDLELMQESNDWLKDQKIFTLWEKPALMVKLHPVQRP